MWGNKGLWLAGVCLFLCSGSGWCAEPGVTQSIAKDGVGAVHTGTGNIIIGYTVQDHERLLKEREAQVRSELKDLYGTKLELSATQQVLKEKELAEIQQQLANVNTSYQERIRFLESTIQELQALKGGVNDQQLANAIAALQAGDTEQADALLAQVEAAAQTAISQAAKAAYERGKIKREKLDYRGAYAHHQRAAALVPDDPEYLIAAGSLASTFREYNQAITWLERAQTILLEAENPTDSMLETVSFELSYAWQFNGKPDMAIEYSEQELANALKTYGEGHIHVARIYSNLGTAWSTKGDRDKAIGYYEQALGVDLNIYPENYLIRGMIYINLGNAWEAKGDLDKAIEYFDLAVASVLKIYGEDFLQLANFYSNLGTAWLAKGELDKAIGYYEQALAYTLKTYTEGHPEVGDSYSNLGAAWHAKGDLDKAIGYYEQALASDLKTYGEGHPEVGGDRSNLGKVWQAKGELDKAIRY